MASPRLPRFKRAPPKKGIVLTHRDREIVKIVHVYRFVTSRHLIALIGGSSQSLLRRLQRLYHHGYLERPRAQIDYYHHGGSRPIVYGLGDKGAKLLKKSSESISHFRWSEKNRAVGRIFLDHALLVSDTMIRLELGCRTFGSSRLISSEDLRLAFGKRQQLFRWRVRINRNTTLGVVPDQIFALELDEGGNVSRTHFFLEADRGTMPVKRKNLSQTSLYRKLLAYQATWAKGLHKSLFGFHRFRVLIVTKSADRVQSLIDACSGLKRGRGLFLFCDEAKLKESLNIFDAFWTTGTDVSTKLLP